MIPEQIEKEIQDASDEAFNYYRISTVSLKEMFASLLREAYEDKIYTAQQALGRGLYLRRMAASDPSLVPLIPEECKKYIASIRLITPKQ